jgi:hypothetical protein
MICGGIRDILFFYLLFICVAACLTSAIDYCFAQSSKTAGVVIKSVAFPTV